ncbi:tyrosine-type recombinase/integrase [Yinghuangia aomiensis]
MGRGTRHRLVLGGRRPGPRRRVAARDRAVLGVRARLAVRTAHPRRRPAGRRGLPPLRHRPRRRRGRPRGPTRPAARRRAARRPRGAPPCGGRGGRSAGAAAGGGLAAGVPEPPDPPRLRGGPAQVRRVPRRTTRTGRPAGRRGRAHAAAWAESMRRTSNPDGSRRISEATIARRLAVASSFYTYAVDDDAVPLADNPVAKVRRPKPDQDGDDIPWLDAAGAKALLAAAAAHSPRAHALVAVMLTTGARVSEVLGADARDLRLVGGHRVLAVTRKGGRTQYLPIAPWVGTTLDDYVAGRDHAPLFATRKRGGGHGRWDEPAVWRLIRLLARRAGLDPRLRPHSLRHTAITMAIETAGLRRAQVMAGHASASTTERYDRARERLDSSPVYALAARLAD